VSSVKQKQEGAEVGVEGGGGGGRGGGRGGGGGGGGGGGVGGHMDSDSSDSEMVDSLLLPGYEVLNEQNDVRQKKEPE